MKLFGFVQRPEDPWALEALLGPTLFGCREWQLRQRQFTDRPKRGKVNGVVTFLGSWVLGVLIFLGFVFGSKKWCSGVFVFLPHGFCHFSVDLTLCS